MTFGIVVEPQIFRPFCVADRAGRLGSRLRLADIVEFDLIARTAEGAGEDLHAKSLWHGIRILGRLDRLEALELGMAEIERLVFAGVAMRRAKMFRLRPAGEGVFPRPDRVRRIEHVIFALGPAQEMELEEPGHAVEMGVAREPHLFERALCALHDLEAIHGDIHGDFLLRWRGAELARRAALVRDSRPRRLVDEAPSGEASEVEGAADLVMGAGREKMREQRAAGGNRLEAPSSPAAIQEYSLGRRRSDDRRRVGDDIDDSAPLPQQLQLSKGREHVEKAGNDDLLHGWGAALSIGRNAVEAAAEHDLAFIRLACVDARAEI